MSFDCEAPETRHMLAECDIPEDVVDGILYRYARELADRQWAEHDAKRPYYHMGLECAGVTGDCYVRDLISVIDPDAPRDADA
jgi:hypothetical protein